MLRFLKKIFGSSKEGFHPAPGPPSGARRAALSREVGQERDRLSETEPGSREWARGLHRMADLQIAAGAREEGLQFYGQSIDAHMELGEFDAATAICRKVLRLAPKVVRARCTLAWLSLGKGLLEMAREHLEEYVRAAREADRSAMAAQHLRLMAQYVTDPAFRGFLAEKLRELDDDEGARRIESQPASDGESRPQQVTWDPVVFAALLTPEELAEAKAEGLDIRTARPASEDDLPLFRPTED